MRVARYSMSGVLVLLAGAWTTATMSAPPPRFPAGAVWHRNIADAPVHPQSDAMIARLTALGGWGNGNRMQIDFSFHVRHVGPGESPPRHPVVDHVDPDADYYLPDCEPLGSLMPVPADAAFEGQDGLQCDNDCRDGVCGDCHLLVVEGPLLYELYNGSLVGGQLNALCLAVWDTRVIYPPQGRGEHCTSADAAGFPIAALLPNADEVAAAMSRPDADLGHAIRFILPNPRMASDATLDGVAGRLYVRPASHAGGPSGPADSVPYGSHLRLRPDFDMAGYSPAAQVILRTMQRYGIVLADGGNIALTFESDRHTDAKWATLGIAPQIFWSGADGNRTPVRVGDFDMLDTGPRIAETYECVRSDVVPGTTVFQDGFEG